MLLLIGVETCPISRFMIVAIDSDLGFGHYASPLRKVMWSVCVVVDPDRMIGHGNSQISMMKLAL